MNGRPIAPAAIFVVRVLVARVEAAHEADHHLELRMLRGLRLDRAGIRRASSDSGFSQNTCLPARERRR